MCAKTAHVKLRQRRSEMLLRNVKFAQAQVVDNLITRVNKGIL